MPVSERTPKDFAIEFGEYLANAAERFRNAARAELTGHSNPEAFTDAWLALDSAVYEFRKRATRAKGVTR